MAEDFNEQDSKKKHQQQLRVVKWPLFHLQLESILDTFGINHVVPQKQPRWVAVSLQGISTWVKREFASGHDSIL